MLYMTNIVEEYSLYSTNATSFMDIPLIDSATFRKKNINNIDPITLE
jgi:hypothetical protein